MALPTSSTAKEYFFSFNLKAFNVVTYDLAISIAFIRFALVCHLLYACIYWCVCVCVNVNKMSSIAKL